MSRKILEIQKTEIEEVNEDDFDNLEVRLEYLDKLKRIRKQNRIRFKDTIIN